RCLREIPAEVVVRHRLGPALALEAQRRGEGWEVPLLWRKELAAAAGRVLLFQHHLGEIAATLGSAGVPWLPIKGMDLASRVYSRPEQRPTGDLDLLISAGDLTSARQALRDAGWQDRARGPRFERFLEAEAYCWQARHSDGTDLELHFRLWGTAPEGLAAAVLEASVPNTDLGPTARRPTLSDAYLLAALHLWMDPPPRPVLAWWDLQRIAILDPTDLPTVVAETARRWHLDLPVLLAAEEASRLWPDGPHDTVAQALAKDLRGTERMLLRKARRQGTDGIHLAALALARGLAGRPSRSGWKAALRRFWAHPGVVERETPESWSWPTRRGWHLARQLRGSGRTRHIESKGPEEAGRMPPDIEER
ncbi:MAG: nucleotidyltransferase family protein, partial [Acidobacteria bacterium]|nr:nucleotidyltransferase family protein [Acidobacteriota bacterium]